MPAGPDEIAVGYEDPARAAGPAPRSATPSCWRCPRRRQPSRVSSSRTPRASCGSLFVSRGGSLDSRRRSVTGPGCGPGRVLRCVGRTRRGRASAGAFQLQGDFAVADAVPCLGLRDGTEGVRPQHDGRTRVRGAIDAPDRDRLARCSPRWPRIAGIMVLGTVPRSAHVARRDRYASAAGGRDDPFADRLGGCVAGDRRRGRGRRDRGRWLGRPVAVVPDGACPAHWTPRSACASTGSRSSSASS